MNVFYMFMVFNQFISFFQLKLCISQHFIFSLSLCFCFVVNFPLKNEERRNGFDFP